MTLAFCHAYTLIYKKDRIIYTAFTYRPLIEKTDFEILSSISECDSEQAKSEFFYRYQSFLLQICKKGCQFFDGGAELADDIFQNTMIKALKGIHSLYKKLPENSTNVDKTIKAWLSIIARNELVEFLRKNPDEKRLSDPFRAKSDSIEIGYEPSDLEDQQKDVQTIEKQKLDGALASLSEKERHILMVYMEYFNSTEPNRHLPDNVIAELCNKYETNSTNLRKIKSRALKKLMKITG